MLELLLTQSDGGTAWRHALGEGAVRAGWECVGPMGLARRLGRLYGLRGEAATHAERVGAYAARLARLAGARSFSRSQAVDPWGVAEFLLDLRDRLRAAGWDGGALEGSPRLVDLSDAERLAEAGLGALPPGLADVLAALRVEIERTALPEPLTLRLAAPMTAFEPVVRRALGALEAKGAVIAPASSSSSDSSSFDSSATERRPLRSGRAGVGTGSTATAAPAASDLGRLQRALLSSVAGAPGPALAGDGSVLLLEADTPLEAGELAAGLLRTLAPGEVTLVEGRDAGALEAALRRQGLPALGVRAPSRLRPALQILPLRLALSFAPRDAVRAAELLTLPVAPLSRALRRRLLEALVEQPGIGGPAWGRALAAEGMTAEDRARVEDWFGGPTFDPREGLPASEAVRLCEQVARWAEGRARAEPALDALLPGAAQVARTLAQMIARQPPGAHLTPIELEQLHDLAAGGGLDGGGGPGQAGRPALAPAPGAVQPGARTVLWWGFLGGEAGTPPEPWTEAEREALSRRGLGLRAPGELRALEAAGWRSAAQAAQERLVLVRWRLEGTTPATPHPLEDELGARFERGLEACRRTSEEVLAPPPPAGAAGAARAGVDAIATSLRRPAPEITPRALFHVPPETLSTERLSPSGLEKLLGCPVAWVLEYAAGLRRRGMARIPGGNRLLGTFAHAILQDVLLGPRRVDLAADAPEAAAQAARAEFDARVEQEAAPLVARGAEVERHRARELVAEAARALFELLQRGGWRPRASEQELEGTFEGARVQGRADLLVEKAGRPAVLDLKLTGQRHYRERLQRGQALQVALYAALARAGGALPATGYFMLQPGELLTVDAGAFPGARELDGPSTAETLAATAEAIRFWRAVLARGVVPSRHEALRERAMLEAGEAAGRPAPASGPGTIEPACQFCEHGVVCGVALREVAR